MRERTSLSAVDPQASTVHDLGVDAARAKEFKHGVDSRYAVLALGFLGCTLDFIPLHTERDGIASDAHQLCPIAVPGRNPVVRPAALAEHAVNAYAPVETMEL